MTDTAPVPGDGPTGNILTYPYTCRHCGQDVYEPGHASECSALDR